MDTVLTPELEAEGFARELARKIQFERKKNGLQKTDEIELSIACETDMRHMLEKNSEFLKERINAKKMSFVDEKMLKEPNVFTVRERKILFFFCN